MKKPILSFCTVAMNRLHHVRQTLSLNIKQNNSDLIQFILLDYGSTDGLEEYIQETFIREIRSGKLIYYKHKNAEYFQRSHSRNMAFRLADGEILCNLDADNYAGAEFGNYLINLFSGEKNICLTGIHNKNRIADASGKLCLRKKDFLNVAGFDESFDGYGFEDYDIINRLQLSDVKVFSLNRPDFLQIIPHDNSERYVNEKTFANLFSVYIRHINFSSTEMLFLFNDNCFKQGIITNRYTLYTREKFAFKKPDYPLFQFDLKNNRWTEGNWKMNSTELTLHYKNKRIKCIKQVSKGRELVEKNRANHVYYKIENDSMAAEAIHFLTLITNRIKMLKNLQAGKIKVNGQFGDGIVYRNFESQQFRKL